MSNYYNEFPGHASEYDKWKYNFILNDLARQALYTLGNPYFSHWVKRFIKALRVIDVEKLPIREKIDNENKTLLDIYYNKVNILQKDYDIWNHPLKRAEVLDRYEEEYWESLFDYGLDIATKAGFTIDIKLSSEGADIADQ